VLQAPAAPGDRATGLGPVLRDPPTTTKGYFVMASRIVSKEREAREQMAFACAETIKNCAELERRFAEAGAYGLAVRVDKLADLFAQLEEHAKGEKPIPLFCLRTTGRLFCDIATKVIEVCELVELVDTAVARDQIADKLGRAGELVAQAFLVVDLPLKRA
jgi:hypothetical protein